jgi:hypothetical protein
LNDEDFQLGVAGGFVACEVKVVEGNGRLSFEVNSDSWRHDSKVFARIVIDWMG